MQIVPSLFRVNSLLDYDPDTGLFFWREFRNPLAKKGDIAGTLNKYTKYVVIAIDSISYPAHRLGFYMYYSRWPNGEIDHINHIRSDNRIVNLREVSRKGNMRNKTKSKRNSTGHTGVYKTTAGNWIARITVDGVVHNLGTYKTLEEAVKARQTAALLNNFHVNHGI